MLTPFGRALAEGKVSESEFYAYIVKTFQFPHPAYSDYDEWIDSGIVIRPFVCILKTLIRLFEIGGLNEAYLTAAEIYEFIQSLKDEEVEDAVSAIMNARTNGTVTNYSSESLRPISEMLAFLSIASYVYIDSTDRTDKYRLNLIMRHPKEKTLFYLQRSAGGSGTGTSKLKVNVIDEYKKIWED